MTSQKTQSKPVKIAVVGDIHDQWDVEDGMALKHLGVDLVLFVGDFGNESVEVVKTIASLDIPKAAVMGNHDAWYSATEWGRKKCPYDRTKEDWVQKQLDLLGAVQVGYSKLDFPQWNLTVVGGRPFTWGGPEWRFAEICQERYGVSSLDDSADKIVNAVKNANCDNIIFLGHNGPSGLGDRAEDPCGKDWHPIGGDFGDPDLAAAISQTLNMNKTVSLVAFGHMHRTLRHTKKLERKAVFKSPEGTIYLNAANVPRIVQENGVKLRNFSLVFLDGGMVTKVALVWVGKDYQVAAEEIFYNSLV
ncbi:TIGR04168 family protein [Dolichospermum circinale]|uniref:TIGR04168 family protein n=2 Tax=Dolichospermum circinale TaxID=109265 RepID=A0ABT5A6W3_9CYAN|nr:TIGR04168 family protein [Dolichospermum circinale]MDB9457013.1 TIGR04168 family protein [Dolichospermum circinale CS-545/17]MDB9467361.1 TIGR04168 family protein [Dolichospermum circinale CS-539/09]MDB9470510.1 TIGR04168 family protein [Dolichospermum circinale CS-539]MDB9487198.1 TIGR04168 family protein [Dolichospermum circinale CS-537/01]